MTAICVEKGARVRLLDKSGSVVENQTSRGGENALRWGNNDELEKAWTK